VLKGQSEDLAVDGRRRLNCYMN